jgi:hypothetical protein
MNRRDLLVMASALGLAPAFAKAQEGGYAGATAQGSRRGDQQA